MIWTEAHDTMLVREILLFEVWEYRHGSPERGQDWESIAENLNKLADPNTAICKGSLCCADKKL